LSRPASGGAGPLENPAEFGQKLGGAQAILATAPSGKAMGPLVAGLGVEGALLIVAAPFDPLPVAAAELIGGDRSGGGLLVALVRRDGALAPDWTAPSAADFLWAGSSMQTWELLAIDRGWGAAKTSKMLRRSLTAAVLAPDEQALSRRIRRSPAATS
jgi:hypothetical protein